MRSKIIARFEELKNAALRLSGNERRLLSGMAIALGFLLVLGGGLWVGGSISDLEDHVSDLRFALEDLERLGGRYRAQARRSTRHSSRLSTEPLELNQFVEDAASAVGLKISESSESSPVEGKRYLRRGLTIKLSKVAFSPLIRLLEHLRGTSTHWVRITRLRVRTRWKAHETLDAELEVSTYEKKKGRASSSSSRSRAHRG